MNAIDLTGTPAQVEAILSLAKGHPDIQLSEPTSLDASRALNVGLPHLTLITEVLTFVTVVFKSGSAGLAFLKALRDELKADGGAVAVSEPTDGKIKATVEGATSDETLAALVTTK